MDINCIVALQIPATGFKLLHCFIREIWGWRNTACSNYSDLIRIREVTWMKPGASAARAHAFRHTGITRGVAYPNSSATVTSSPKTKTFFAPCMSKH